MGEEYLGLLQEGFDNRWIDIYENEGKRSGAYSWGVYGCHPYVLLNFHGTLNDVFTLPSLTVKFIKTPLKALFYLGFSAVPFRFTI